MFQTKRGTITYWLFIISVCLGFIVVPAYISNHDREQESTQRLKWDKQQFLMSKLEDDCLHRPEQCEAYNEAQRQLRKELTQ